MTDFDRWLTTDPANRLDQSPYEDDIPDLYEHECSHCGGCWADEDPTYASAIEHELRCVEAPTGDTP